MPPTRTIAKPKVFTIDDLRIDGENAYRPKDSLTRKAFKLRNVARRIPNSPHKSILISYLVRAILDHRAGFELTQLQKRILMPILKYNYDELLIKRFNSLPNETYLAFDQDLFRITDQSDVDRIFIDTLNEGNLRVYNEISQAQQTDYQYAGGFVDFYLPATTRKAVKDYVESLNIEQNPCPPLYQLRLEYNGITTHKTHDRTGGVEPYLVTSFFRVPYNTTYINEISSPMKVEQHPKGLVSMPGDHWMPSGGVDQNGNPNNPIQFYPNVFFGRSPIQHSPYLIGSDFHCAVISVWEEDGDDSAQVMKAMSEIGYGLAAVISAVAPGAGEMISAISQVFELVSLMTAANDDEMGAVLIAFDREQLDHEVYHELSFRVGEGENDWTIYIGAESRRVV